ncbi:hypothetical protein ACSFA0_25270 [Variovorax sp. LT1P1]|uniref:ADP-ribosyltransferase-containing protein n=1 Tax=Variovorax sp. LT1P1 TaxID=3443730 RepID=UPI003F46FAE6
MHKIEPESRLPVMPSKSRSPAFTALAGDPQRNGSVTMFLGKSVVVEPDGSPMVVYHGTNSDFTRFDSVLTRDGGFHFGTAKQASVRVAGPGSNLLPAYLCIEKPRRSRDAGGAWRQKIRSAKSAGFDGIVYLNRYEGVDLSTVQRALLERVDLDKLTDAQFRRYAPEARDSYIAFEPQQIRLALAQADAHLRSEPAMPDPVAGPGALESAVRARTWLESQQPAPGLHSRARTGTPE